MLEKRFQDEIGETSLTSRVVSHYLSRRIKKNSKTPRPPVVSDPPPRWSYYHTFDDDRVWVRKGRKAKKPVPYDDRRGYILPFVRSLRQ
jgi:hypothetical protein